MLLTLLTVLHADAATLSFGAGGTFGVATVEGDTTPHGSPMLSVGANFGRGTVRASTLLETQPTLFHPVSYDVYGIPVAMATLALDAGDDVFRLGLYGTVGLLAAGGGLRLVAPVKRMPDGSEHAVELRFGGLVSHTVAATALWSFRGRPPKGQRERA